MSVNRIFTASRSALQAQKANAALFKSAMKPMAVKGMF
jgi:F-type H+-transporting ATPase subunit beta